MDPNWDERWKTNADKADKYEEEDGYSLVLSSVINGLKYSSARRKMWGEDGNGARLLSCGNINE
jgi:hypothetical protein